MTENEDRPGAHPWRVVGRRHRLVAGLAVVAVLMTTVVVFASRSSNPSPGVLTSDQQAARTWAQENGQMWTWMQSHWDEMTLMHQHWGDVSWMRENLPDFAWMHDHWSGMAWMHDHWSGMAWMHTQGMMGTSPGGMMGQSGG